MKSPNGESGCGSGLPSIDRNVADWSFAVSLKVAEPRPTAATISETAARQSATLRSMLGKPDPHPDSPFGDSIPF